MSQQLVKKGSDGRYSNVMPKSWIEAIKDKGTGQTLVEILQGFNMYFLPYNGNTSATRCSVPMILRKKGLWITYVKYDGNVYTEWYAASDIDDKSWGDSSNWRIGTNTLVGDITISANGNWVINGAETEFKAVGERGNTPLIRVANNRLQVSYDLGDTYRNVTENPVYTQFRNYNNKIQVSTDLGATWTDASDEIAAYFRWLATTGDTQANNVGRLQISRDNKTWTNLSNDIINNLHISKYIGANESLPTSGIAEGTIYAKGPTYAVEDTSNSNPIYRLWVYAWKGNTLAWQDNGEFTSIAAGIVQETGDNENAVMSQKATTEAIHEILYDVSANNAGAVFESISALLSSPNLSTLIPISAQHGGMTIRFIQGSEQSPDNKYVQYFLTKNVWSANEADWEKMNLEEEVSKLSQLGPLDNVKPININGEFSTNGYDKLMFSQKILSGIKYNFKVKCVNYDGINPVYITVKASNGSNMCLIILRDSLEVDYEFILAKNDTISILYGCASPQVVTYELYSNDSRIADLQDKLGLVAINNYDASHYNKGYVNGRQVGQIATIASGTSFYTEEITLQKGETLKYSTKYDIGWATLAKVLGSGQYLVLAIAPINLTDYTDTYTAEEDMSVVICGSRYDYIKWAVYSREYLYMSDCVDNLVSNSSELPLSARQGKILDEKIKSAGGNLNINSALYFRDKIYERWGYWVSVPSVATSYADNAYLDKKITQVPAGKHFIFITDTHIDQWVGENGQYHSIDVEDQSGEHYDNTNYLIGYVKSKMGIQNVVFGGDCLALHNNNDEPYQGARYLSAYSNRFFATFGKDGIWVQGNHDANGANAAPQNVIIPSTEIFLRTVHAISDSVVFDEEGIAKVSTLSLTDAEKEQVVAWMKMHYYKDDAYNKIRFIVCETGDEGKVSKDIFYTMRNSVKSSANAILAYTQWIIDTIRNTPKGYDIVLLGHYWQQYGLAEYISQIVTAYLKHQRIQIDVEWWITYDGRVASDALMDMLDNSTILVADFSGIERNGRIFMLGGHMHYDAEFVHKANSLGNAPVLLQNTTLQDGDALNIFTLCSMVGGQYSEGEIVSPEMIAGTTTEHAFDVVTITDDNKLVMTRFGAGDDRIVDLSYQINY